MDLLGLTVEGERRLATRLARLEESHAEFEQNMAKISTTVAEIGDKLNALINIVDGSIRGKQ